MNGAKTQILRSKRGSAILNALFAGAMVSIVALLITNQNINSVKNLQKAKSISRARAFEELIVALANDPMSYKCTLGSTAACTLRDSASPGAVSEDRFFVDKLKEYNKIFYGVEDCDQARKNCFLFERTGTTFLTSITLGNSTNLGIQGTLRFFNDQGNETLSRPLLFKVESDLLTSQVYFDNSGVAQGVCPPQRPILMCYKADGSIDCGGNYDSTPCGEYKFVASWDETDFSKTCSERLQLPFISAPANGYITEKSIHRLTPTEIGTTSFGTRDLDPWRQRWQ